MSEFGILLLFFLRDKYLLVSELLDLLQFVSVKIGILFSIDGVALFSLNDGRQAHSGDA